jgi:hypothetical protein
MVRSPRSLAGFRRE